MSSFNNDCTESSAIPSVYNSSKTETRPRFTLAIGHVVVDVRDSEFVFSTLIGGGWEAVRTAMDAVEYKHVCAVFQRIAANAEEKLPVIFGPEKVLETHCKATWKAISNAFAELTKSFKKS